MGLANKTRAWIKASRITSQSYIALPLILGQLLATPQTGHWDWTVFALVQAFGIFDQLYIVFANDVADYEADQHNDAPTMFSGGSRVLVDQDLTRRELAIGALVMAVLALVIGASLTFGFGKLAALPLVATGLILLWAYSYPPFKLSYRGGGELLQMLGVGAVLPLLGFVAQADTIHDFPWPVLAMTLPASLATAMCTALPDEPADRRADKHTVAVAWGLNRAMNIIIGLNLIAMSAAGVIVARRVSPGLDANIIALIAIPAIATLATLALARRAKPGARAMLGFVFLGALVNISLIAGMIVDLLGGADL